VCFVLDDFQQETKELFIDFIFSFEQDENFLKDRQKKQS